ncbi:hypothetical protein BJ912DRAFT_551949 [Pholiota molesta]|nr:hypothetical protein BJ912DRAFT_551949 [Pholiota molesta]
MHSRKTITIVTSPPLATKSLPTFGSRASPTTKPAPVYRVEERSRTVYISSDIDPSQWDTHSLNTIFSLAEVPESDRETPSEQPIRRTQSYADTEIIISEEASDRSDESRVSSPRISVYRTRRAGKSASAPPTPPFPDYARRALPEAAVVGTPKRILFYHKDDPHYGFTNFSPHPVVYNGKKYPTSEHLFQSFKFQKHRPNLAEHIRTCSERPSVAFSEARRFQPEVRADWKQVNIEKMDETLFHKFTQHADLRDELLATGDAELVEDSDKDAFWGVGADRRGRNELGKCLERLRSKLRGNGC